MTLPEIPTNADPRSYIPTWTCPDCQVHIGQAHDDRCDVARCLYDGGQRFGCDGEDHDCGDDRWSGQWPGTLECIEFGWWSTDKAGPLAGLAEPDLNRLAKARLGLDYQYAWSRELRRVVSTDA